MKCLFGFHEYIVLLEPENPSIRTYNIGCKNCKKKWLMRSPLDEDFLIRYTGELKRINSLTRLKLLLISLDRKRRENSFNTKGDI